MFCHQCGREVAAGGQFCPECGAKLLATDKPAESRPRQAGKEDLLREIERALAQNSRLVVSRGDQSDLEIKGLLADAKWLLGRRKVEYSARVLLSEAERTVIFWEMTKEAGWGIPIFGGFQVETYKTDPKTRSGSRREVGHGPKGRMIDYAFDYAETRKVVEDIAAADGWKFTVVLRQGKAKR